MATTSPLSVVLSAEEFQSLSDSVRIKVEDLLKKHDNDLSQLKIQYAKLQTQSEQQCFELDSQLQQLQEQGSKEETLIQELTNGKAKAEADLASSQEQLKLLASKLTLLEANCQELKKDGETLLQEKENLSSLLSRRNDDLDRLTGELKTLTDQLVHANREKSEAIIKTEELNSKQLALEYKEKRLDQERELMIRQQRLLQDELDSRTKEVMNIRREKTSKVLELQADLSEKIEELRIAQKTIGELTTKSELHEKHIKELSDRLKELSETEQKMSENNRHELRSQMRLCELYKASSEDAQAKAEELTKATEELQRLLRDASARFGKLETDSKAQIDQLNERLQKSSETNNELKKELERANALLDVNKSRILTEENIEAMSPSAAAASRLLKSGMTLTQIYSQYVSISEQLLIKEEENKKLNSYIDQILQEIEERAPSVARLKEDYEKSVEMVANLTRQLDLAVEEADTERENALEARRLLGQSQRSSQRLEKQVNDLSKQVCFLVRETEELRGNRLRDEPVEEQVTSSEGSAAAIISRHLVTFRDVEELQQRNQMLLTTLREVTEKQDAAEQSEIDTKTAKIQQALENALSEVEHLRDTRRRHEELMEGIIQQRDMYRILLQEAGWGDSQSPTKFRNVVTSTPAPARQEGVRSTDVEMQLNESKIRLEEHETNYQNLVKEKKELEKALNDKIQILQDQLTDLRAQNIRLSTQTQYADEKEKLLQGNLESCKKQLNALEEKNKIYACTVAKHEQSIAVLRDEAMNAQQQLARAEVAVSMLQEEKQLLKDAEQRLLIERNSLVSERHSQGLLHANLESIKLNLERGESETRMRLQNTVSSLEQQTELLRKKLDLEEQRYQETVKNFEEKIQVDKDLLKAAEEKASQAEIQLAATRERLAAAESRTGMASPTRKVQVTRLLSTTPASGAPADSDLVGDLRAQLAESRTETSKFQEQLELVRQQAEQYRSIADSMEEQLSQSNKASQAFKQETEQHLIKLNEERAVLIQELQETKDKLKSQEEGAAILDQETAHQSEEVSMRISRLEIELASMTEQFKMAEESEAKARHDSLEQTRHAKEAQEKYERELMQHAADVEQLNVVREQLEQSHSQLSVLQQTLARVETELTTGRTSWDAQKEMLEKEASEKARRCAELDKQVDVMQQQIVTLSSRMAAATRLSEIALRGQSGEEANTSLNTSLGEEETRSSDQLLELVRFLRREKEIAISRSEVQEAETQRLKTQLEQAERHLIDVQNNLHQERERAATSALTSEKHTEMLRRLETLNALTDSNRLLREERSNLASRAEELGEKVKALEAELEPLRTSNQESTSRLEELSTENQTLRKQVVVWRTRTNALQERAGRATADEVKKLQSDKDQLQKQMEQIQKQMETMKEAQTKTANQLTETQRTNTQLITAQQKWQEEARVAKEEARGAKEETQKVQSESTSAFAKRDEETAKAAEQANQLRRIARKYKTQYEELKVEYDKLVQEKEKLVADLASSTSSAGEAAAAASLVKEESTSTSSAEAAAQAARIQELEAQIAQLTAEIEQLKQENQVLRTNDEKSKVLMKSIRQKLAQSATVTKEKDAALAEVAVKTSRIEQLEQSAEEATVHLAALRSQLEGRISRLERENSELLQTKQILECEIDQLTSVYQRQSESYQKQLALLQQQQVQQTPQQPTSKTSIAAEKSTSENPPTANIKPMASGTSVTPQRPPVSSSPGQVASVPGQMHRTTPTASIRPMAMTTRTLAVQPTSVSVSPMAPPLIAITTPTPVVQPNAVVREDEPVAGPSFSSGAEQSPSAGSGNEDRSKKRTRGESPSPDSSVKRTRLTEETEEEVEIVDVPEGGEETVEEYAARSGDMDLVIEYEEQPQDDNEEEEEEVEEGLIESEEEEMVETVDADEEEQEEEGDEIVVEVEEQREEVEEQLHSTQEAEAASASATNEEASGSVEVPVVVEEEAVAPVVVVQQQPAEEIIESETFAPTTSNESAPPSTVPVPANIRPPPREDRLPSFGRSTLAFEDGGDDGIVPSTPVLLRPRTNDGFAEAVSSPQVNTRFVFGTVPDLSLPAMGGNINAPSHLESQCMEDTRMDLSQLEDNSGRSVPSTPLQVSPHDELPAVSQTEEASVVPAGNVEEQGDFEGGPDLEGDAAAEIDLLGEDDADTGENEQHASQPEQEIVPSTSTEEEPLPENNPTTPQQAESTSRSTTPPPITSPMPTSPVVRPPMTRRGTIYPRGRGMSREDPRLAPSPNPNRPVPITWTPNPAQPIYRENPARVFRRSPAVVASPAAGVPSLIGDPIVPGVASPVQPLMRGRGVARRTRSRAGRRM